MKQNETNKVSKISKNLRLLECELCDYKCYKQSEYNKHLATQKHKKRVNETNETDLKQKNAKNAINKFECILCNETFKSRTSLWRHGKTCDGVEEPKIEEEPCQEEDQLMDLGNMSDKDYKDMVLKEVMKENKKLKEQLIEQDRNHLTEMNQQLVQQNAEMHETMNKMIPHIGNGGNTNSHNTNNITNNNTFNMNIFLNEQCKDALNIMDFVTSVKVKMSEVEDVGALGYAEGIGRIFVRALNELDVYQRPIHCSDLKRETLYIKDENGWEKEDETNPRIKRSIRHLAHQNVKAIPEWKEENSSWQKRHSQTEEQYYKITGNSMGACEPEGNEKNYNKIIRKVAKEVTIDKSKL